MEISNEHRLTEVEERCKSNTHRIDELVKRQDNFDELVSTVKVLAVREEKVENDVKEIKTDVKSLTEKPAKRWDSIVDKGIGLLLGALLGYIFTQIGL